MIFDLCIVGGGINGAGIARDAAGRGLSVLLLERGDLGCETSSNSSKMIHGGLRYLEFFEFSLVQKSLAEREVLMRIAPQIVRPLRLCIPHRHAPRPAWMVRLGLFLYDLLSLGKTLPSSESFRLSTSPYGLPLKDAGGVGFAYSDCRVDDARLVLLNAMDARDKGAEIRVRTPVKTVRVENGVWHITTDGGEHFTAKVLVNATGPSARRFLEGQGLLTPETPRLKLVQGSHIVVPRLYDGDFAYLLQCPDKRVVFVFPYEEKFSLVGTTETAIDGSPFAAKITPEEEVYLLDIINRTFKTQTAAADIVHRYCGVRPLFDDGGGKTGDMRTATRDYKLEKTVRDGATLLTVWGGKITTYRPLAEEATALLRPIFPAMGDAWTAEAALPRAPMPFAPTDECLRYFIDREFARTPDDIFHRRTKWGVSASDDLISRVRALTGGM